MLKHKLPQTMGERDYSKLFHGIVELDDAYLGRKASRGKRGRGAQRKTPSLTAQGTTSGHPEWLRLGPAIDFSRHAVEGWAQQQLKPVKMVRSDGLACFLGRQRHQK